LGLSLREDRRTLSGRDAPAGGVRQWEDEIGGEEFPGREQATGGEVLPGGEELRDGPRGELPDGEERGLRIHLPGAGREERGRWEQLPGGVAGGGG